jgi:hypothetical protein
MADSRADVPVLEQSRRLGRRLALILVLALLVAGIVALLRPRREQLPGHAFTLPAPEGRIVVEVLNGTRRQGLARVATRMLRRRGIDVVSLDNADATTTTRILVRRGESDQGRTVAAALGAVTTAVVVARDTLRRVDVSVILGPDFRPEGDLHP